MARKYEYLGKFTVLGNQIRVTDPGYDKSTWCAGVLEPCVPGTYEAFVSRRDEGDFGIRNDMLLIRRKGCKFRISSADKVFTNKEGTVCHFKPWIPAEFEVGVDSGQAGFFDEKSVFTDEAVERDGSPDCSYGSAFFNHCCDRTLSELSSGVITHGCISSSGYGDGAYYCYYRLDENGTLGMACIIFL